MEVEERPESMRRHETSISRSGTMSTGSTEVAKTAQKNSKYSRISQSVTESGESVPASASAAS